MRGILTKTGTFIVLCSKTLFCFLNLLRYGTFKRQSFSISNPTLAVIANGPSLNDDLPALIQSKSIKDFCCVNSFVLHPAFLEIRPNIYVLADPLFWLNNEKFIKEREPIYEQFRTNVSWNMTIFIPNVSKKFIDFEKLFENNSYIKIQYANFMEWTGFSSMSNWVYKNGWFMPRPQNVVVPSIFTGINCGYKTIELYGVDHSWTEQITVDQNNNVCMIDRHFYEPNPAKQICYTLSKSKALDKPYKMHELLRDFAFMFESYHKLRSYADYKAVKVINCTKNSYLDAFERR